jgi:hypothetical protein
MRGTLSRVHDHSLHCRPGTGGSIPLVTHPEPIPLAGSPYGYDVHTTTHTEVVPKPPPAQPRKIRWRIGPVSVKLSAPPILPPSFTSRAVNAAESEITVQLTADQQVALSITGTDKYGNAVDISGDTVWTTTDDTIVTVTPDPEDSSKATAAAVGPVGTAAITVSNDVDQDGTGDYQGSLAIDVVAGQISEIVIQEGAVTDKEQPEVDNSLPTDQPEVDNSLPPNPEQQ